MKRTASSASDDLEWLLGSGDQVMGLSAQAYDSDGVAVSWDDDRITRAHLAHLETHHRRNVQRHARVSAIYNALSRANQRLANAAFQPRAWDTALREACGKAGRHGTLAGIVVTSAAATQAFARARKRQPKGGSDLLTWLVQEARSPSRLKVFKPLATSALRELQEGPLAQYEAIVRLYEQTDREFLRTGT